MVRGFWGKKIGMTQVFSGDKVVPVTVIDASGWLVTQVKKNGNDGYAAIQVGRVKNKMAEKEFSPDWLKKLKNQFEIVREVRLDAHDEQSGSIKSGQKADFFNNLAQGDLVDVAGKTKGCGFAGVVRRHNFGGAPASHGHTMGKRTGSLSFMATQGRVIKGKKMPGHMGNKQRMVKNLEVVNVNGDTGIVALKGAIPGKAGSLVYIQKA